MATFMEKAVKAANEYNALKMAWDRTELMERDAAMKAAVKIARMHLVNAC